MCIRDRTTAALIELSADVVVVVCNDGYSRRSRDGKASKCDDGWIGSGSVRRICNRRCERYSPAMHRNRDRQVWARDRARYSIWISWFQAQLKGLEELADFTLAARKVRKGLDRSAVGKLERVWKFCIIASRVDRSLWTCVWSFCKTYRLLAWKVCRVQLSQTFKWDAQNSRYQTDQC